MRYLNGFASIMFAALAIAGPAAAQPLPGDFVLLRDIDQTIIQDIRYAGSNNFARERSRAGSKRRHGNRL
jgi:D-alanyl-D-alanine dipeptidase